MSTFVFTWQWHRWQYVLAGNFVRCMALCKWLFLGPCGSTKVVFDLLLLSAWDKYAQVNKRIDHFSVLNTFLFILLLNVHESYLLLWSCYCRLFWRRLQIQEIHCDLPRRCRPVNCLDPKLFIQISSHYIKRRITECTRNDSINNEINYVCIVLWTRQIVNIETKFRYV